MRRIVIFGRNDLVQDAPISRIDLLVCRNTLMYFNAATQAKILARFHFALSETGYLFLGRAETLLAHNESFSPVDLKRRIFMKVATMNSRNRPLAMAGDQDDPVPEPSSPEARLRDASWDVSPLAQLIVDARGNLVVANDRARSLSTWRSGFRPTIPRSRAVVGPPISVPSSTRRTLVESRSSFATSSGRCAGAMCGGWSPGGATLLRRAGCGRRSFDDVTAVPALHRELEKSNAELRAHAEELQSTE